MSAADLPKLLNVNEAAALLGLSASTLNKLRLTAAGPVFIKMGVKICYAPADLSAWLETRRHSSTAEYTAAGEAK